MTPPQRGCEALGVQLRQVLGAEVGEAAEILVDAFATDPFLR